MQLLVGAAYVSQLNLYDTVADTSLLLQVPFARGIYADAALA